MLRSTRNAICTLLAVQFVVSLFTTMPVSAAADDDAIYDSLAAVAYADAHWNDGVGVCDQFVKACLAAGGINITVGYVMNVRNKLLEYGTEYPLVFRGGSCYESDNQGHVAPGDILFWYCQGCADEGFPRPWPHTAIINRIDENGIVRFAAHNSACHDKVLTNTFSHSSPTVSGVKHSGSSISYYVVHIPSNTHMTPVALGDSFNAHITFKRPMRLSVVNLGNNNVMIDDESRRAVEDWHLERQSDGTYMIRSFYNGYVLDVDNADTADGTNVQIYPQWGDDNGAQKWYIYDCEECYRLSPKLAPSKALNVTNGDFSTGSNIQIYEANNSDAQIVEFYVLHYTPPEGISLDKSISVISCGSLLLTPTFTPEEANTRNDRGNTIRVQWKSQDESVAKVDENGAVTGYKPGKTTITATSLYNDRLQAQCEVTVSLPFEMTPTLPVDLKEIEAEAFQLAGVETVVLPSGCRIIGEQAFTDCQNLSYVFVPESVEEISDSAFSNSTGLTIFCYPNTVAALYAQRNNIPSILLDKE